MRRLLSTPPRLVRFFVQWVLPVLVVNGVALLLVPLHPAAAAGDGGGISLSPSVVMLKGTAGQAHRQALRLTNTTERELTFDLVAEDIVAEGERKFLPAGDRADSIAATAVFSPRTLVIAPNSSGTADVTFTVPSGTAVRAVAAIFRSRTPATVREGVGITASLGALFTFTLSGDARLETTPVTVTEQTDTVNLRFTQAARNAGTEPLYFGGAVAVLDAQGTLVARMPIEAQRLLPGEQLQFHADYPTLLAAGRYRAVFSLEHTDSAQSTTVDFAVAPPPGDQRLAGPAGGGGPR